MTLMGPLNANIAIMTFILKSSNGKLPLNSTAPADVTSKTCPAKCDAMKASIGCPFLTPIPVTCPLPSLFL